MKRLKIHELKILSKYFLAVKLGLKNFEIRKNDRDYHIGDIVVLQEYENEKYTGNEIKKQIKYIVYGPCYGLTKGHCVMSLGEVGEVIKSE
ncbi:DUF3850 domain-containing protein [Clostridium sp. LP20]|uniref:DUF3850 domain-containing protein n=1 Tax=Clostridium sp. LP20 TaxID=3418665 RepID=UPI003EE5F789